MAGSLTTQYDSFVTKYDEGESLSGIAMIMGKSRPSRVKHALDCLKGAVPKLLEQQAVPVMSSVDDQGFQLVNGSYDI